MTSPKKTRSTTREKLKHDGYMYTVEMEAGTFQFEIVQSGFYVQR
jgi:hypothetical protein